MKKLIVERRTGDRLGHSAASICRAARPSAVAVASFVAVVLLASLPVRADVYWSASSGDWSVASNWGGTLPISGGNAWIVNGGTANVMQEQGWSGDYTDGNIYVGYDAGSNGALNLSAGSLSVATSPTGNEYVGWAASGVFNQSGGTNVTYSVSLGFVSGSSGTFNLNGGLLVLKGIQSGNGAVAFNFNSGVLQAGGSFSTTVAMTLGASGSGATFDTSGFNVTLSGSLSGPGGLTKVDSGTLILAATDTYSGNTLVSSGMLALGSPLALQDSTLDTSGSGALSFGTLTSATFGGLTGPGRLSLGNSVSAAVAFSVGNNNAGTTYSGVLQGSGSLIKVGSGTLLLAGSNTYTGPTTINQGNLAVNGSLLSPVTVQSGGILSGTGSLSSVTVTPSGQLAPGNPSGAMNVSGSVNLEVGAVMDYELDSPSTSDEVLMPTGELILSGQQFSSFNFTWTADFGPGTYDLITFGSSSGSLGANTSGSIDGLPAALTVTNNDLVLTVVPEPSTLALLGAGVVGLIGWVWRRRPGVGRRFFASKHAIQERPALRRGTGLIAGLGGLLLLAVASEQAGGQTYTNLFSFTGASGAYPGIGPDTVLTLSGTTLYGMTESGGTAGLGSLFRVGTNGSGFQNIASFSGNSMPYPGEEPVSGLALSGTTLYGLTASGGTSDNGTLFGIGVNGSGFQSLLSFSGLSGANPGVVPLGGLTLSGTTLYGTTYAGGASSDGNVFSVGVNGGGFQNLLSFSGSGGADPGQGLLGNLALGGTTLYGMTYFGSGNGTVYSVGTNGSAFRNLVTFSGSSGAFSGVDPQGSLLLAGTTLYGMTQFGGSNGLGNVFSVGTNGSNFQNLLSFTGTGGASPGSSPSGSLTLIGMTLYGMTGLGGGSNEGTLFSIGVNGAGFHNVLSFTGNGGAYPGGHPKGDLTAACSASVLVTSAGNATIISGGTAALGAKVVNSATSSTLYGMPQLGGSSGLGDVFSLTVSGANNLNYTLGAAVQSGGATLGAITAGTGSLASGGSQSCTVSATSTTLGVTTISFTGSDPNSSNLSQTATASLTVLDHAAAAFTNSGTVLTLNFGTLQLGSGTRDLQYQIENLPAAYRAGLALESVMALSDPSDVFSTDATSFADLPAGQTSGLMDLFLNPSQAGNFSGQYQFNLADETDLSGHAGGQTLTLNVTAEVVPEPSALALLGASAVGLAVYASRASQSRLPPTRGRRRVRQ